MKRRLIIFISVGILAVAASAQVTPADMLVFDAYDSPKGCYVFAPSVDRTPDSLGLAVMLHGYGALNPMIYGQWIREIVEAGNVVIYPRYQRNLFIPSTKKFVANALAGIEEGLTFVKTQQQWPVDTTSLVYFGHSYGGVIASHLLAHPEKNNLPPGYGALLSAPGTNRFSGGRLASYAAIPPETQVVVVTHAGDHVTGTEFVKQLEQTVDHNLYFAWIAQTADSSRQEKIGEGHNEVYAVDTQFDNGILNYTAKKALRVGRVDALDTDLYWPLSLELITARKKRGLMPLFQQKPNFLAFGTWTDGTSRAPLSVRYQAAQEEALTRLPAGE